MYNLPDEIGLYWAKRNGDAWENIVEIRGVKPFLSYRIWHLRYPLSLCPNTFGNNIRNSFVFSDKIDTSICCESIQITKPGLYLLSGRVTTLAFITGTLPYMVCYTWDTKNDTKEKYEKAWLLPFAKYIEKPDDETEDKTKIKQG